MGPKMEDSRNYFVVSDSFVSPQDNCPYCNSPEVMNQERAEKTVTVKCWDCDKYWVEPSADLN